MPKVTRGASRLAWRGQCGFDKVDKRFLTLLLATCAALGARRRRLLTAALECLISRRLLKIQAFWFGK